jgi:Flp pilus assembly protein TadG
VVILLVALVLLFIVAALAALAIDLVTFYTARSEAQLAADSVALAGARALANSGLTSDPTDANLRNRAENLARNIALQEALQNQVGGRFLNPGAGEVTISFDNTQTDVGNPRVVVRVSRADLPTFFARIWGRTQVTVSASAIAEAYNPSFNASVGLGGTGPVAPTCVKPWLLPNLRDSSNNPIFDSATGTISDTTLLGQTANGNNGSKGGSCTNGLCVACPTGSCQAGVTGASAWQYYPGSQTDFPAPSQALPACSAGFSAYQLSIAGCVQQPMVCGQNSSVTLAPGVTGSDTDTADAVTCLTHAQNDQADRVDTPPPPPRAQPFQFIVGNDNPVVNARGHDVMVSSSLVTVPVVADFTATPQKVIGFVQVFLNPAGTQAASGAPAMIVNLAGCGTNITGQPILGNGASPVAVRLISQ